MHKFGEKIPKLFGNDPTFSKLSHIAKIGNMTKEQFEAYQFSTIEYDEVALGLEDAIKEGIEQGMEKGMEIKEKEMTIKGIEKALLRKNDHI